MSDDKIVLPKDYPLPVSFRDWQNEFQMACAYFIKDGGPEHKLLKQWIKKYPPRLLLEAAYEAGHRYLTADDDGSLAYHSMVVAFRKTEAIADVMAHDLERPNYSRYVYIQGVLRKRSRNKKLKVIDLLEAAHKAGADIDWMEREAKRMTVLDTYLEWLKTYLPDNEGV